MMIRFKMLDRRKEKLDMPASKSGMIKRVTNLIHRDHSLPRGFHCGPRK